MRDGASWLLCLLGVWMLHAPLVLWTASPAAYQNSSMVGILRIAFSVVIPRRMWRRQPRRPEVPLDWTFNPSSRAQRTPSIALAWSSFLLARYLAANQLGHIPWPRDPLFGDGTQRVLDSAVSEAFPVADAGLGAAAYALEFLIGHLGDTSLWRTFWLGGEDEDGSIEERAAGTTSSVARLARAMVCGTTLHRTLLASTVLGVGLIAASGLPAIAGRMGDAHVIVGALVIVISIVSMSEVVRRLRLANAPVALAMAALV